MEIVLKLIEWVSAISFVAKQFDLIARFCEVLEQLVFKEYLKTLLNLDLAYQRRSPFS